MLYLYTALVGIPLILIILYIYGSAVLRVLHLPLANKSLALITGLAALLLSAYVSGHLYVRSLTALLIGLSIAWYIRSRQWQQDWQSIRTNFDRTTTVILLLFSILFALFNAFSGIITPQGFEMRGTNSVDGFIHLSYAHNLVERFPPTRPVFADIPLTGYHYFFPLFVAQINLLFGFSVADILFRITPFILALVYGLSFYLLAQSITKDKNQQRLIVLASYVTYSTLPLIPNFFVGFPGIANPLSFIHNPSTLMAAAFLNAGLYAIIHLRKAWGWVILAGIFIGILAQTKVYAGMIGLGTLGAFTLVRIATNAVIPLKNGIHIKQETKSEKLNTKQITNSKTQNSKLLKLSIWNLFRIYDLEFRVFCIALVAGAITFTTFFLNNAGSGSLVWAPFRFFDHFMEQSAFVSMQWPQRKAIFAADHNYARVGLLYLQALAIFFFIHLGTRVFAFVTVPSMFQKKFWQNDLNLLIVIATMLSFLIPTIFIQSVSVFDIAQTFWFGATLLAIPSAIGLHHLTAKFKQPVLTVILVALFILPFGITYLRESRPYLTGTPDRAIPHTQLKLFAHITEKVTPSEFLFFIPAQHTNGDINWSATPVLPAMTARSVYFERSGTPFQLSAEAEKRIALVTAAVTAANQCNLPQLRDILATANTKHLISTKPFSCLTNQEFVDNFIETGEYSYYRFK